MQNLSLLFDRHYIEYLEVTPETFFPFLTPIFYDLRFTICSNDDELLYGA